MKQVEGGLKIEKKTLPATTTIRNGMMALMTFFECNLHDTQGFSSKIYHVLLLYSTLPYIFI